MGVVVRPTRVGWLLPAAARLLCTLMLILLILPLLARAAVVAVVVAILCASAYPDPFV